MTKSPITHASWLFVAVIITAVSGWYYVSSDNPYILDKQTLKHMPDIIANNIHLTQYDKNGRIKHDLVSEKMTHLPADDRYLFLKPLILIASDNQNTPWTITAKRAISVQGGALIELNNKVRLIQNIDKNKYNDIITDQLFYEPIKKLAYTDKPIEFRQPGTIIKAIGMQAELDTKHVRLLKQAQGAFTHANA